VSAQVIPDMGATRLAPWLTRFAAEVPPERAIVEVGSWLGAGTQHLVRERGPLYVYDRFQATQSEVAKAAAFGVTLAAGQDTLPFVKSHVTSPTVRFVKGNINKARYKGPAIGLYVDDASKLPELWEHSMKTFERWFVKGETILVLMDYHFPPCDAQREYAEKWMLLEERVAGTCAAVFLC
jgi:hypothetical protein